MKRKVLNSPRLLELKRKRLRVFLSKIILSLVALLIIFAGLAYISRFKQLNISGIEITGNKIVDSETIKVIAQKELTGNYLWFFPKTNIFFYPKNNIKKELYDQLKRIEDISLSVQSSEDKENLEISVSEREAKYTWCADAPDLVVGVPSATTQEEKCYFMDSAGYIFDEAPYFSGGVYFKFYGSAVTGTYFFKENFKPLVDFKDTLVTMGLNPVSLYVVDNGDIKIFLSNSDKTSSEPYITFNINSDYQRVAENLETALNTEPLLSNFKNKYSSLQYIDLRFGNKVYYKFR